MKIHTNVTALQTYRSLIRSNKGTEKSMQRLSSGVRINSVKDDPAGMAITLQMRNQLRGLNMAERNTMDGISLIQTAEGALNEVHDMIQRMRELSIKGATDSYEPDDREKLNMELGELMNEIDLISRRTEFNGMKLLNGSAGMKQTMGTPGSGKIVRTSADASGGEYSFMIDSFGETATLHSLGGFATGNSQIGIDGLLNINGETISIDSTDTGFDVMRKLESVCNRVDIQVNKDPSGTLLSLETNKKGSHETIEMSGDSRILNALGFQKKEAKGKDMVLQNGEVNHVREDGKTIDFYKNAGDYKIEGDRLFIYSSVGEEVTLDISDTFNIANTFSFAIHKGGMEIQVGQNKDMSTTLQIQSVDARGLLIDEVSLLSRQGCADAIKKLDRALELVSQTRSTLGGYQNRFEYTANSLMASAEQTSTAMSRIYDTDMAMEMTELAKYNIIYQAGISIMAQANMRPQQMMQLFN